MKTTDVLGHKAHDTITGFTGTITGIAHYLTGCTQYLIEASAAKDDKAISGWFDDSRVEVTQLVVLLPDKDELATNGGPQSNAPER